MSSNEGASSSERENPEIEKSFQNPDERLDDRPTTHLTGGGEGCKLEGLGGGGG